MPGKDGIDACREITAAMPGAKVLMLTAFTDRSARHRAAREVGYLPQALELIPTPGCPAGRGRWELPPAGLSSPSAATARTCAPASLIAASTHLVLISSPAAAQTGPFPG